MGKVKRISRPEFLEARLGYVAMLHDRGECAVLIQGATDLRYPHQVETLIEEVEDRDKEAAQEEMVEDHAINLYNVYRHNCQTNPAPWSTAKDYAKERWREIAKASLRHGRRLAIQSLQED